jgi:hypothetical protein
MGSNEAVPRGRLPLPQGVLKAARCWFASPRWDLQEARRAPCRKQGKPPASPVEKAEVAHLCALWGLTRTAVRSYEEAFAVRPRLLTAHRYDAALEHFPGLEALVGLVACRVPRSRLFRRHAAPAATGLAAAPGKMLKGLPRQGRNPSKAEFDEHRRRLPRLPRTRLAWWGLTATWKPLEEVVGGGVKESSGFNEEPGV